MYLYYLINTDQVQKLREEANFSKSVQGMMNKLDFGAPNYNKN